MADWAVDYSKADDTGAGNSWAAAKKTLKAATDLAAAGDTIYVDVGTAQAVTVDTTWTMAAGVRIIASNDTANFPPTVLSTAGGIISPTSAVDYTFNGGPFLLRGFRLKPGASTTTSLVTIAAADDSVATLDSCALDVSNTSSSGQRIRFGPTTAVVNSSVSLINCTFKFGSTAGIVSCQVPVRILGGSLESGSSVPAVLFGEFGRQAGFLDITGFDFSGMSSGSLFGGSVTIPTAVILRNCKLGAAAISDALTIGGLEVTGYDCSSADEHYQFFNYAYAGSTTVSTAIYANDGAEYDVSGAKHSWVVAGNANTRRANPYVSPWFSAYNEATSAVTPYIEILRDGSATAFTDIQVASDWMLKTAGGSPLATLYSDYGGHLSTGTAQDNGVGLSGWTGESGTAWSGRLYCPSVTPAEIGHVSVRVIVYDNLTAYADPLIRGL